MRTPRRGIVQSVLHWLGYFTRFTLYRIAYARKTWCKCTEGVKPWECMLLASASASSIRVPRTPYPNACTQTLALPLLAFNIVGHSLQLKRKKQGEDVERWKIKIRRIGRVPQNAKEPEYLGRRTASSSWE